MKPGTLLGVALLTVGLAALTASTLAQGVPDDPNGDRGRVCDAGMLKGTYGTQVVGQRPGADGKPEQFVALALGTFDGQGTFTQVDHSHGLSGTGVDRHGSGTYTVNPDCTGTLELWTEGLPFPIQSRLVVFDKGAETRGLVMSPAVIVAATTGRRVF
ncbi:hypothetical protein LuPra_00850 [Luteitalea pratensis]|uniref:Uncharacterized protein n=1 Tax=Luteitalea pratensis TaxID=1855912 RepID=A0A143PIT1_LUTPR|nr:hypothetical protein [Luteitalea pratensis]AMY07674.1 hypothetical protein LuPra_00850 [Luteitalea pratensis]